MDAVCLYLNQIFNIKINLNHYTIIASFLDFKIFIIVHRFMGREGEGRYYAMTAMKALKIYISQIVNLC